MHKAAALGCTLAMSTLAAAAPPANEIRYDGPHLSFAIPAGTKVKDGTDVVADYALDLSLPLTGVSAHVLLSLKKVVDADVDALAGGWRSARVRNRTSWGMHKDGEARVETLQIGSRRFVRYVDQMGSVLGPMQQLMLCGSVSSRLLCGVVTASPEVEAAAERFIVRVLETATLRKK